MKTFIIFQMLVDNIRNHNAEMSIIIRKVDANSREEAIGKFVIETESIQAFKKLNIQCIELSDLKSL
jgi:hypothetical protein